MDEVDDLQGKDADDRGTEERAGRLRESEIHDADIPCGDGDNAAEPDEGQELFRQVEDDGEAHGCNG